MIARLASPLARAFAAVRSELRSILFVGFCLTAIVGIALISLPAALIIGGLGGAALTLAEQRGAPK